MAAKPRASTPAGRDLQARHTDERAEPCSGAARPHGAVGGELAACRGVGWAGGLLLVHESFAHSPAEGPTAACSTVSASQKHPTMPLLNPGCLQVEQDVVCQTPSLAAHYEAVQALVGNLAVDEADRLRVTLLFGLRYERDGQVQLAALLRTLTEQVRCTTRCCAGLPSVGAVCLYAQHGGVPRCWPAEARCLERTHQSVFCPVAGPQGVDPHRLALLRYVLKACRAEARVGDLFSDRSMTSRFASLAKQHLKVGAWDGWVVHSCRLTTSSMAGTRWRWR